MDIYLVSCWCPLCLARTLETPLGLSLSLPVCLTTLPHCRAAVFAAPGSNHFSFQPLWRCDTRRRWKTFERERNENEREPSSPSFPKVLSLLSLSPSLSRILIWAKRILVSQMLRGPTMNAPYSSVLPFLWSTVHLHFLPSFSSNSFSSSCFLVIVPDCLSCQSILC